MITLLAAEAETVTWPGDALTALFLLFALAVLWMLLR